jgi:hypothetical protein
MLGGRCPLVTSRRLQPHQRRALPRERVRSLAHIIRRPIRRMSGAHRKRQLLAGIERRIAVLGSARSRAGFPDQHVLREFDRSIVTGEAVCDCLTRPAGQSTHGWRCGYHRDPLGQRVAGCGGLGAKGRGRPPWGCRTTPGDRRGLVVHPARWDGGIAGAGSTARCGVSIGITSRLASRALSGPMPLPLEGGPIASVSPQAPTRGRNETG